jgi:hypothetical protein
VRPRYLHRNLGFRVEGLGFRVRPRYLHRDLGFRVEGLEGRVGLRVEAWDARIQA